VSNKLQNYEKELQAIMYALAESVAEASDEDILTETQEDGENPESAAERVRNVLLGAVKDFRQRRLVEAQRQYELHIAAIQERTYNLPATAEERRKLLDLVFAQQPAMRSALLTAQHRDFTSLTDTDVESCLKQLQELGLLDELSESEEEKK
jgi:hypothetical protein